MTPPAQAAGEVSDLAPDQDAVESNPEPVLNPNLAPPTDRAGKPVSRWWRNLPSFPDACASLLRPVVVAMFLLCFVFQPFLIPSSSMERTLLVGDFLLFNKQVLAPASGPGRWLLPYRDVERGDIIVFHHPKPRYLVKRVVGLPGDRLRVDDGRVTVNGKALYEPYADIEPSQPDPFRDSFPGSVYDPSVDPSWWRQMQSLTQQGELVVPEGEYFVLGDNRNNSTDSRFWGFVRREEIVARPLVIYFSISVPYSKDAQQAALEAGDDRLGHDRELSSRITGFARWKRIFRVVH
jgi:signal peptidase I